MKIKKKKNTISVRFKRKTIMYSVLIKLNLKESMKNSQILISRYQELIEAIVIN